MEIAFLVIMGISFKIKLVSLEMEIKIQIVLLLLLMEAVYSVTQVFSFQLLFVNKSINYAKRLIFQMVLA